MSAINRPPLGLQSLLGSQNFGDNPNNLLQNVIPTVDLFPFWGAQKLRMSRLTGARTGDGLVVAQAVDEGQIWAVVSAAMYIPNVTGAGGDVRAAIGLRFIPGEAPIQYHFVAADPQNVTLAGGEQWSFIWTPPQPLFLESATSIDAVYMNCTLANADTLAFSVLYYELDI